MTVLTQERNVGTGKKICVRQYRDRREEAKARKRRTSSRCMQNEPRHSDLREAGQVFQRLGLKRLHTCL